jgi:hypothetical protein
MLIAAEVGAKVAWRAAFGVLLTKSYMGTGRGSTWVKCRPGSSKMGRTGECVPPSRRLQHDRSLGLLHWRLLAASS